MPFGQRRGNLPRHRMTSQSFFLATCLVVRSFWQLARRRRLFWQLASYCGRSGNLPAALALCGNLPRVASLWQLALLYIPLGLPTKLPLMASGVVPTTSSYDTAMVCCGNLPCIADLDFHAVLYSIEGSHDHLTSGARMTLPASKARMTTSLRVRE